MFDNSLIQCFLDKVLYARKTGEVEELPENLLTGKKISVEDAIVRIKLIYKYSRAFLS